MDDAVKEIGKGVLDAAFSEAEKRIIERYYGDRLQRHASQEQAADDEDADDDGASRRSKGSKKDKHKKKGSNKAKGGGARPGLAEEGGLPPGIRKKLERGGELPPGIAKRELPEKLEAELPPPPEGYERAVVEDKVVLIDAATGVITDIFRPRAESSSGTASKRRRTQTEAPDSAVIQEQTNSAPTPAKRWWEFWK